MKNLQPLGANVIVKPIEMETTTASGIIIATESKEKPMKGEIVAIGAGTNDEKAPDVQVGDKVYFTKYAPTEIKINGEELYVMDFKSMLAVER